MPRAPRSLTRQGRSSPTARADGAAMTDAHTGWANSPGNRASFSADWLALRAGADRRARDEGLAARLSAHFAVREGLRVLDLGAGTGAMLAATAPLLPSGQSWRLVDGDAALLARVSPPDGIAVERVVADLA